MEVTISQTELKKALDSVIRAVPSRPTHPILANVLMECKDNTVYLAGFDLTLGIKTHLKADIEDEGTITLPAKLLSDIVAKLPDGDINISCDDDEENPMVKIVSGSGKFHIRGVASDEYPELPSIPPATTLDYDLPIDNLKQGISNTAFATSTDDAKQVLTGIHISQNVDRLEFASTDGHRLSVIKTYKEDESFEDEFKITVPSRTLKEVERLLIDAEKVSMMVDNTLIVFEMGNTTIVSRSLDGEYPKYHQLIPTNFERSFVADRKAILDALDRVSVFTDQKNNMIKFSLVPNEDLVISVEAKELGNAQSEVPVEMTGEALDIGFNLKYLSEGLRTMNCKEVKFQINGATQPVILTPLSGLAMTYLIMPVQIRE
jgi:DNA polymerase III subunit beta